MDSFFTDSRAEDPAGLTSREWTPFLRIRWCTGWHNRHADWDFDTKSVFKCRKHDSSWNLL